MNEQQFLQNYSQDRYDRPSIATDIAAFSLRTVKSEAYRASPELKLCVLLIKRGGHPFQDHWALPGGFLQRGESIDDCAFRELKEETNLQPVSMLWVDTFSQPDRDPRGWIISHAYASVIAEDDAKIIGGSDATDAQWFEVVFREESKDRWHLELRNGETILSASLQAAPSATAKTRFTILENNGLAFDHASILASALDTLRREGEKMETVFAFLPEKFTLFSLQKVQETLLGITLLTANFRRKIADFVEETDEYTEGAGHRPARLFRKKTASQS
jgi:ADP-ribose pyrophosphatase YjhB (NUDIX family)